MSALHDHASTVRRLAPSVAALAALGVLLLAAPARTAERSDAAQRTPKVWFAPLPPLPTHPGRPYVGSTDFMKLFTPAARWKQAAKRIAVFKLYGEWVTTASEAQLRIAVRDLKRRGIPLAVEWGPLDATSACGQGIEGFSGVDEGVAMARRIKRAGGTLRFLAFDEPFFYASLYDGPQACRWSATDVAKRVIGFMSRVRSVFPGIHFGDIEPITRPSDVAAYKEWMTTFRAATSETLGFLHLDMSYTLPGWDRLATTLEPFARARGIPFGLISFGEPSDPTDTAWLARAQARFESYEADAGGRPDHVILQSWQDRPNRVLPETVPTSYTSLVNRYARPRPTLTLALGPDVAGMRTAGGRLVSQAGRPVAGAAIEVVALLAVVGGDAGAPIAQGTATTTADGRFEVSLAGLPPSGIVVRARYRGSPRLWPATTARAVGAGVAVVSRGRPASASSSLLEAPPTLAFDGDPTTAWNAGSGPPAWVQVELSGPTTVFEITLRVAQTPAGPTTHRVSALVDGKGWVTLADLAGTSVDDEVLTVRPPLPVAGIRTIRVETSLSPSFVAWKEIEVVGA